MPSPGGYPVEPFSRSFWRREDGLVGQTRRTTHPWHAQDPIARSRLPCGPELVGQTRRAMHLDSPLNP
jgi:hypothetical protein